LPQVWLLAVPLEKTKRMERRKSSRLVPDQPFPPYAYIPTRSPHPVRDPEGHSYGEGHQKVKPPDPERWQKCRPYLYGIDLFNHGYYWEAHDAWEVVWLACGRKGVTADFLKGLIKLAAAGVKAKQGQARRAQRQAKRAEELLKQTANAIGSAKKCYMGLPLAQLVNFAKRLQANNSVKVTFRFKLRPLV